MLLFPISPHSLPTLEFIYFFKLSPTDQSGWQTTGLPRPYLQEASCHSQRPQHRYLGEGYQGASGEHPQARGTTARLTPASRRSLPHPRSSILQPQQPR